MSKLGGLDDDKLDDDDQAGRACGASGRAECQRYNTRHVGTSYTARFDSWQQHSDEVTRWAFGILSSGESHRFAPSGTLGRSAVCNVSNTCSVLAVLASLHGRCIDSTKAPHLACKAVFKVRMTTSKAGRMFPRPLANLFPCAGRAKPSECSLHGARGLHLSNRRLFANFC